MHTYTSVYLKDGLTPKKDIPNNNEQLSKLWLNKGLLFSPHLVAVCLSLCMWDTPHHRTSNPAALVSRSLQRHVTQS